MKIKFQSNKEKKIKFQSNKEKKIKLLRKDNFEFESESKFTV